LGNIFHFDDGALRKLDYGIFPNGIRESILQRGQSLPLAALRALYIAYDPARSTLYVSLQRFNAGSKRVRFNVSALPIDGSTLARKGDWRTVFESEDIPDEASFRGATGGRMVVAGDRLFFSVGDYNFGQVPEKPFEFVAQSRESAFGKNYEHELRTGKTRVKSIGHRNPQGLAVTAEGKLLDAEQGPEGGDELNVVVDGKNYGWPYRTHGTHYGTFTWPIKLRPPAVEFTEPLYAWVPSVAISPLIQVDGFHEHWKGDLLAGSLKAQSLFRMRMVDDRIVFFEQMWIGHRIRDIVELPGKLVLMTDDPALVVVTVDEERLRANSKLQKHVEFIPALAKCVNCHHFGPTNPSHMAPSLANVMSRRIASDTFERYSDALKNKPGAWDKNSLARFIADPNGFAPGSTMPGLGLSKKEIEEVVTALARPRLGG
jgi:cytochrome c2